MGDLYSSQRNNTLNHWKYQDVSLLCYLYNRSEQLFFLLNTTDKAIKKLEQNIQIDVEKEADDVLHLIEKSLSNQMKRIKDRETGKSNSTLFFTLILETKDLVKEIISLSQVFAKYRIKDK